jgi:alpha-tubulin suppressor-like RCC1 family protein
LTNAYLIAVGNDHSVAIQYDYSVWAWGFDDYGQLGNGANCYQCGSSLPAKLSTITGCSAIAAGAEYTLVRKNDGTVWAWGNNYNGQLGNMAVAPYSAMPVQTLNMAGAVAIVSGGDHSLALKGDGTVWSWGHNWCGQLGNGTYADSSVPAQIPGLTGVVKIGAGSDWSFAIKNDGTLWAWGENDYGMLGNNTYDFSNVPVQVSGLTGVVAVTGGWMNSLALKKDGTVWAWGGNYNGELGNGTGGNSPVPIQVPGLANITAIAAKGGHCMALQNDGTLWAWGPNWYGQLGNGTTTGSNVPVVVSSLNGIQVTNIAEGSYHSLAITNQPGTPLFAWGDNSYGQVGNCKDSEETSASPVYGITGVTAIAGGDGHSVALKNDHTVWTWGENYSGQLGNGDTGYTCAPGSSSLPSGMTIGAISAGYSHTIALYSALPPEIAPGGGLASAQTWSNKNTQTWPANASATSYNVYRGVKAGLPKLLNRDYDSCLRYQGGSHSLPTPEDPTSLGPGDFYWYIVTGVNSMGEGPAGDATSGTRMINSTGTCP